MRSREPKPVVLTTVPYYLPGFKGGGKLITVRNLVAALSSQFRFKVLTADRDLGEARSYGGIPPNQWITNGECEIFYADSQRGSLQSIREQLRRTDYDVLHLNSVFSRPFGIVPLLLRRFGRIARRPDGNCTARRTRCGCARDQVWTQEKFPRGGAQSRIIRRRDVASLGRRGGARHT